MLEFYLLNANIFVLSILSIFNPLGRLLCVMWVSVQSTDQISTPLSGRIVNATLVLHGTSALPEHRKNGARIYDDVFSQFPSSSHRVSLHVHCMTIYLIETHTHTQTLLVSLYSQRECRECSVTFKHAID